jgi:hypothetical protein
MNTLKNINSVRVKIAEDVISRINSGQLEAVDSCDIGFINKNLNYSDSHSDAKQLFENSKCLVSARGALFFSIVCLNGNINMSQFIRFDKEDETAETIDLSSKVVVSYMSNFFDLTQLDLMEDAFLFWHFGCNDFKINIKASDFGKKFNNDKDRLIGIMQNLIDNDGEFKP